MKKKLLNVFVSNKFGVSYSIIASAIFGGLLYGIGRCIGNVEGMNETNDFWTKTIEDLSKKESQEKED